MKKSLGLVATLVLVSASGFAATPAVDDSSSAAYSGGWTNGSNGGTGFTAWTLTPTPNQLNGGFFIGSATNNGSGCSSGGGIDVNVSSWGLYANTTNFPETAIAYRGFTGGSLGIGQTFGIALDNGNIDNGGFVGFVLRNQNNTTDKNTGQRFEFFFAGGDSSYHISTNFGSATIDTGITFDFNSDGIYVNFTLTGADAFSVAITTLDGSSTNITGALGGTQGAGIDSVALYNQRAGESCDKNLFFNRMNIQDLRITSIDLLQGSSAVVGFLSATGTVYDLQSTADLVASNWSSVVSNIVGSGSVLNITNPVPIATPQQFYRVRLTP